jgi:hypothetical protein
MKALALVARNFVALFIDDGMLAALVLAWIAFCGLVLAALVPLGAWRGPIFFLGLSLILIGSVVRATRADRT